jgi:hypothetical protein
MNLTVEPESVCKILTDIRELIRENILPRLTELEEQVRLLRKVTWPVCQSLRELKDHELKNKREFLEHLYPDEAQQLVDEKVKMSLFLHPAHIFNQVPE